VDPRRRHRQVQGADLTDRSNGAGQGAIEQE
jgi:hypothetical protein